MPEIIDSHHHLWRYNPTDYPWITAAMPALRRDFLPQHLIHATASIPIQGTIAVQARQSLEETHWVLDCAAQNPSILGVVGWAPLTDPNLPAILRDLCRDSRLKALRHIVQDEPDDHFLLRDDFNRGIATLLDTGLAYDVLIFERHLPQAIQFVRRHPQQRFVLDHLAKPSIRHRHLQPWRDNLLRLAENPNIVCKLSGLVTEADWHTWTLDDLRPCLDTALQAFGPSRLMAGSDWPVCLLATTYSRWWSTLLEWLAPLPLAAQQHILATTARNTYAL